MANEKIGFIGGGKMAEAILAALAFATGRSPGDVIVSDVSAERRDVLARTHGVIVTPDNRQVLAEADIVFLCVKPQQLEDLLVDVAPHVRGTHLVISIAAGKRLAFFESRLPAGRVVRVMPNLAALVGASMNAYCLGGRCRPGDRATVDRLLSSFGQALAVEEALFDAVTALSGSGPAFVAHWVESAVQGGVGLGLSESDARVLTYQTLLGTARLLAEGRFEPQALIQAVSSAKGTTVAGMEVLTRTTMADDLRRTLAAAAARSRELSA
ncbi:MAG: pyrroline-5-carboxylate reductase [Lentisphaerae bacterium]|nr:pyrroline-5-carboxylate reductase [Lentisphaerota bacterium]